MIQQESLPRAAAQAVVAACRRRWTQMWTVIWANEREIVPSALLLLLLLEREALREKCRRRRFPLLRCVVEAAVAVTSSRTPDLVFPPL